MFPSPTDLFYFSEVAKLLNISRAAECLGISQPSLTISIRRVEKAVGTTLFLRNKRGVSLTVAGKQFLAYSRQLLQQWHEIKTETLASVNEVQGCFTIGCHPSVALYSLPLFLADLVKLHPRIEIKLLHDCSKKITEQVINLKVDMGIVVNPAKYPDLVMKYLDDDKVTLWRNENMHPIQDVKSGRGLILCDPNLMQTQSILKDLKKKKIHYERLLTSDNLELIADLTKSGCGIGILPAKIALPRGLIAIDKMPALKDEIYLVYRGENRQVKTIQVIADAIKGAFIK